MVALHLKVLALLLAPALRAQDAGPPLTLKLATHVVTIAAVVRDRKGHILPNLTASDFALAEDAQPTVIQYFSQGSQRPLTLCLMLDTSGSVQPYFHDEISAAATFFRSLITRTYDRAALVQFDREIHQLQYMTNSVGDLEATVEELPVKLPIFGGATRLYDAVVAVSRNVLGRQNGRRVMVIASDGLDEGSQMSISAAIAAAQRADIVVYTVLAGPHGLLADQAGSRAMRRIAESTGGRVFNLGFHTSMQRIFNEISEDIRSSYEVGYTTQANDGRYHALHLTTTDPALRVQARTGFWSTP